MKKLKKTAISVLLFSLANIAWSIDPKNEMLSLEDFISDIKKNIVFVQGKEFEMGLQNKSLSIDAPKAITTTVTLIPNRERIINQKKEPYMVTVSSFSVSRFKTTNKEYQYYLKYNNLKLRESPYLPTKARWDDLNRNPLTPAHVDWNEANNYCTWLAEVTNLPFSLPTDAQWEFIAKSGGKIYLLATERGYAMIDKNINRRHRFTLPLPEERFEYAKMQFSSLGYTSPLPGHFMYLNDIGVYELVGNGYEWVKDWYAPRQYNYTQYDIKDPQGPVEFSPYVYRYPNGNPAKTLRGIWLSTPTSQAEHTTYMRKFMSPNNNRKLPFNKTVRCVVNQDTPIM